MAEKIRVIIYCHIAHDNGTVMESQKNYLRHWAAENGFTVVGEITEVGSGTRMDRSGLSEVMQAVQEKKMDALVVRNLARLTRHPLDACQLMETLREKGIDLICTDEKFIADLLVTRF